jgi:hypothetical protein
MTSLLIQPFSLTMGPGRSLSTYTNLSNKRTALLSQKQLICILNLRPFSATHLTTEAPANGLAARMLILKQGAQVKTFTAVNNRILASERRSNQKDNLANGVKHP